MKTPKKFQENLKEKIITEEMLDAALYSMNKRAKNWRNKKREYKRYNFDKYHNYEKAEENEQVMYEKKERLLSIIEPECVHKEHVGFERIRVYSYQLNFDDLYVEHILRNDIVWENCYYNYETDEEVYFFDHLDYENPIINYYLYYTLKDHTFHSPISEADAKAAGYKIEAIGHLLTDGDDIQDLVSVQFVDKVIELIDSKDYSYRTSGEKNTTKFAPYDPKASEFLFPDESYLDSIWEYVSDMAKKLLMEIHEKESEDSLDYILTDDEKKELEDVIRKTISTRKNCPVRVFTKAPRVSLPKEILEPLTVEEYERMEEHFEKLKNRKGVNNYPVRDSILAILKETRVAEVKEIIERKRKTEEMNRYMREATPRIIEKEFLEELEEIRRLEEEKKKEKERKRELRKNKKKKKKKAC